DTVPKNSPRGLFPGAEYIPRACISFKAVCAETLPRTAFAGSVTSLTGRSSRLGSPAGLGFVFDVFIVFLFFKESSVVSVGCHKCTQDAPSLFHQRVEQEGAKGNRTSLTLLALSPGRESRDQP